MTDSLSSTAEWKRGWTVVMAAAAGMSLAGIATSSIGVMIGPLEQDLGWSRTEITSGPAIISVIGMCLSTFIGLLIDRLGARRVGIAAALLLCGALAGMMLVTQNLLTWWLLWGVIGIASATMPTVWITPINKLFNTARGMALAVTLSGSGISAAVVPLLASVLAEQYGWRGAYLGLAALFGLFALPLLLLFFRGGEARPTPGSQAAADAAAALRGPTAREGFRTAAFFKLALAGFGTTFAGVALLMNLVPIFVDSGIDARTAAGITGLIGVTTIFGRVVGGFLMDRMSVATIGTVLTLATIALPAAVLMAPGSVMAASIGVVIYGLTAGSKMAAIIYLAGRHFGTRAFGTLFGAIQASTALGVGVGPILASLVYDLTGSYQMVLVSVIPMLMLIALCFAALGRYPNFEQAEGQPAPA